MTNTCFKCGDNLKSSGTKCDLCGWNGGVGLTEEDDHYLVLVSLIYRVPDDAVRVMPYIFQIESTAREMAVLEHGDQCDLEGTKWRIAGKNPDKGIFFVKGFRVIQFPNRRFFEFEHEDPVEEIREEMLRWRNLHFSYEEMWRLKKSNQLREYLFRREDKKASYRNRIQDESPYLG